MLIVLNVHVPNKQKSDDSRDSFYEELEKIFDHFPTYHTKIMLGDFNEKLGREDIFELTIGNESLHQDSSDNGVKKVSKSAATVSCTAQQSVSASRFCNFMFPRVSLGQLFTRILCCLLALFHTIL